MKACEIKVEDDFRVISGPCAFESVSQIQSFLDQTHSKLLRAGIFKLRTSPTSFQGLREKAIDYIRDLKKNNDFCFVSEVVSEASVELLEPVVDVFQVGARNMYNYELLKYLNKFNKPIILKRSFSATLEEWLSAASYIENSVERVILCERGIRTFETAYRNTFDINAIIYLKQNTDYKIYVDPSHGSGDSQYVKKLTVAAFMAGADGALIEVHPKPSESLSDAKQALSCDEFLDVISELRLLSDITKRKVIF